MRYSVRVYRDGKLFKSRTTEDLPGDPGIVIPILRRRVGRDMTALLSIDGEVAVEVTVEPFETGEAVVQAEPGRDCLNCQAPPEELRVVEVSVAIGHGERTVSYGIECRRCGWKFVPKVAGAYGICSPVAVLEAYNNQAGPTSEGPNQETEP